MRNIFTRIKIDFRLARVLSFIVQDHFAMYWLDGVKELRVKKNVKNLIRNLNLILLLINVDC